MFDHALGEVTHQGPNAEFAVFVGFLVADEPFFGRDSVDVLADFVVVELGDVSYLAE